MFVAMANAPPTSSRLAVYETPLVPGTSSATATRWIALPAFATTSTPNSVRTNG